MNDMTDTDGDRALSISCDECSMQSTTACADCVVSFVLRSDHSDLPDHVDDGIILDVDQVRVVRLLGKAGLVPDLKYRVAS